MPPSGSSAKVCGLACVSVVVSTGLSPGPLPLPDDKPKGAEQVMASQRMLIHPKSFP